MLQTQKQKNKKIGLFFSLPVIWLSCFLVVLFFGFFAAPAQAESADLWGEGVATEENISSETLAQTAGLADTDPRIIIANIIRVLLGLLGIAAVVLIIYGGWVIMTSSGAEDKVQKGKDIIKNSVIGLVIIISAFGIASLLMNALGQATGEGGGARTSVGLSSFTPGGAGAIGSGIIKYHYPEASQKEVPRNTNIIITFKEAMDPATICDNVSDSLCAEGALIIPENIRVFKVDDGDACEDPSNDCQAKNATDINVYSRDNKTFVFSPAQYLGASSQYFWYTVYLSNGIKKANGEDAFRAIDEYHYEWDFEVSNKADLTPPQILEGGIFPPPDDERDTSELTSQAIQAQGSITVLSQPLVDTPSAVSAPQGSGNSGNAAIEGTYNCLENGTIALSINSDMTASVSGVAGLVNGDDVSDGQASLGCGLALIPDDGNFESGNSWSFDAIAEITADTLGVGQTNYIFGQDIGLGQSLAQTAQNIASAIDENSDIIVASDGASVDIAARVAGNAGNNIELRTSGANIDIAPLSGGSDEEITRITQDARDQSRNAVIKIDFNEPMNPLTLSGQASLLRDYLKIVNATSSPVAMGGACSADADCASFNCRENLCEGENDYLEGEFVLSNMYKTLEFISNNECGVNGCGEKIYCFPANSSLKLELRAASLEECLSDNDCAAKSPYTSCGANGICQNTDEENYPLSDFSLLDGAMDAAFNSLDGNRNESAQGPISFYDQNNPSPALGDSYAWSFFISDELDLTPPRILTTEPISDEQGVGWVDPLNVTFNKVMMSNRLTTGRIIFNNGIEDIEHSLINIINFTDSPLGYWITNIGEDISSPPDGQIDRTIVNINHTDFNDAASYRAQIGSGVKDIYQNCFNPSDGPACDNIDQSNPSCCSGQASAASVCQ